MHRMFSALGLIFGLLLTAGLSAGAQVPDDCRISAETLAGIRLMLTAEDSGIFFEIWTHEEIACACIDLYYNDPSDAGFHDRVITGAVVLLGMTEDPRAVPVLIDAIDTHPPQALYALGNFPTVEALNALVAHVCDENPEARENAAEGLRRMPPSPSDAIPDGWQEALAAAIDEVDAWLPHENEADFILYFYDARSNLSELLEAATAGSAGTE